MILENPDGITPYVADNAYVSESAVVIGNVEIREHVYIAPNASIRADEPGSKIIIESGCNIQDNSVLHALENTTAHIMKNTSLAHSCIIHGPCTIEKNCFIGFGSILFNCTLEQECIVLHRALIKDVKIPAKKVIPDGTVLTTQKQVETLPDATKELTAFAHSVTKMNHHLAKKYTQKRKKQ